MGFGGPSNEWMLSKYDMTELRQVRNKDTFISHFGGPTHTQERVKEAVDLMLVPGAFERILAAQTMEVGTIQRIWSLYFPRSLYEELLAERQAAKDASQRDGESSSANRTS